MVVQYSEPLDRSFHALGDGTRRAMLSMLAKGGACTASELGDPFDIAQPTASKHIKVLERAGLISREIDGRVHRFYLEEKPMKEAEEWFSRHREFWAASLDSLERYLPEMTRKKGRKK